MQSERRGFPRHTTPLQGAWHGASGGSDCRIVDISWSGCFVQTLAQPGIGEQTLVTVPTIEGPTVLRGAVAYVEPGMGFSVKFQKIKRSQYGALFLLLGEPKPGDVED